MNFSIQKGFPQSWTKSRAPIGQWWIKAKFKSVSYVNVLISLCFGSEVGLFSPFPLKQMKESESRYVQLFLKHGLYSPPNSLSQNTGVGSLSLLQGIFPTQGSNPGLPHCRRILYQLSHKERVFLYTVVFNMPYYNVYWPPQKWNINHLNSFSILTYTFTLLS